MENSRVDGVVDVCKRATVDDSAFLPDLQNERYAGRFPLIPGISAGGKGTGREQTRWSISTFANKVVPGTIGRSRTFVKGVFDKVVNLPIP